MGECKNIFEVTSNVLNAISSLIYVAFFERVFVVSNYLSKPINIQLITIFYSFVLTVPDITIREG